MPSPSVHDLGLLAVQADALVAVLAEDQRLAVLEDERACRPCVSFSVSVGEGAVVEDVAVLEDLDERRAAVLRGRAGGSPAGAWPRRRSCARRSVASAPSASAIGSNGWSTEPDRRRLGHLAELGGRRVLALGQPVDAVVEQQDVEVDVAAQDVDQVVAADRERVAVAGDDPHRQLGPRRLEPGGDRRRAAVDGVEAVGVHVVREAARAADAGDEDEVLARDAELGQHLLHLREDRVVAAARAPADVLVG